MPEIGNRISRFADRNAILLGKVIRLTFLGVVLYIVLAVVTGIVVRNNRDTCNLRNNGTIVALREATANKASADKRQDALTAAIAVEGGIQKQKDIQLREAAKDDYEAAQGKIDGLIQTAELTGEPTAEGAVTIACNRLNPYPLPFASGN